VTIAPVGVKAKRGEMSGFGQQVIVQIEAFEEPLTHIGRNILTCWQVDKVNGAARRIQHNATILTSFKVFFDLLAQFSGQFTVDVFRQ
jgi:hypothetical protein